MLEHMASEIRPLPRVPGFVTVSNAMARRLLRLGPLMGPNALLTVRGRKSGVARTTPVALVEVGGKRWVVGTFGDVNWVRNLRQAQKATITAGKQSEEVDARELSLAEATGFFRDVLGPYARSLRIGPLLLRVLGAGDILEDPAGSARKRPVFELSR
jgi:deazaflavin-dependent oxidoreductase (nitroreductase family)